MPKPDTRIAIESVTTPGYTQRVDRANHTATRNALLKVLPNKAPGLTVANAKEAPLECIYLRTSFQMAKRPVGGSKRFSSDLEAKGIIARAEGKPVRLFKRPKAAGPRTSARVAPH